MHKNERVIIIAPVGQDAAAMATLLDAEGFESKFALVRWIFPANDS